VAADLSGLLLFGLLCPLFSQLVVLPVHTDYENKENQGRQKDRYSEKDDSLAEASLYLTGWKRMHRCILSFTYT
jgi:hypothetical protein